jgi:hypothetical protein
VNKDLDRTQEPATSGTKHPEGTTLGPAAADVLSEVERIRGSHSMSGCNRLLQLLDFVVGSTLRGDAGHLKETTIGVEVFGRSPDYDPKVDTIVRSQAWRLRTKLRKYYASEGAHDPLMIDIPTGQYVPAFHVREHVEIG